LGGEGLVPETKASRLIPIWATRAGVTGLSIIQTWLERLGRGGRAGNAAAGVRTCQRVTFCPMFLELVHAAKRGTAIPATGRGRPYGCERSTLPHFLDSRITDGDQVTSLKRRPPFTPRKIPGTLFC
jgi:hypothetical protein